MEFHLVRFRPGNPLALKDSLLSALYTGPLAEDPPMPSLGISECSRECNLIRSRKI